MGQLKERHAHIQLRMIISMAFSSLLYKRFRSLITILGVFIGIGAIYLLVSFGVGLQQLVQSQIIDNASINTIDVTSANSKITTLTPQSVQDIGAIDHVTTTSGVYTLASKMTLQGSSIDLVAYGVDQQYLSLASLTLVAGSTLDTARADQVLVNQSLLQAIGVEGVNAVVGQEVTVTIILPSGAEFEKTAQITGVISSGEGSEIFLSKKVFEEANAPVYAQAKVLVGDRAAIPEVRRAIESLGYDTASPVDTIDQINQVFRLLNLILIGLGSIGMVIAILGMLNTLTVSLLERTKEIALMVALGARPKDMRHLFTAEAVILALAGGVAGIVVASGIGRLIDLLLNSFARDRGVESGFTLFATSWWLVASLLIFMALIGVIVSFVPARRASRINVVDALRRE